MKATKKMVSALLSITSNEILVNLITDILHIEEENGWRGPVIQELLEETREFYEPKDIDVHIVEDMLSKDSTLKDKTIIDGSVDVLRVFNTQNEITGNYNIEGEDWVHRYSISIDDYLKAKEHA